MSDLNEAAFWPQFKAAGFLTRVRVKPTGRPQVDVDVGFVMPNRDKFGGGVASTEYEIEYQFHELPTLAEGDPVTKLDAAGLPIKTEKYKVRQAPFVADQGTASTGYFRHAVLTKL
jgi:hypothetical protein